MPADRNITLNVTQDCINRATRTPQNCPMAQAAATAGVRMPYVGYANITGFDHSGEPVSIPVTTEMHRAIRRFDNEETVQPASFDTTARSRR